MAGGLAAQAYGSTRALVDIDLYVPTGRLDEIAEHCSEQLRWGPGHVREAGWDIVFLKLERGGQEVELGGADEVWIQERATGRWIRETVDLAASVPLEVLGLTVPVMPRESLVAYKRRLDREVDRQDLREMGEDR